LSVGHLHAEHAKGDLVDLHEKSPGFAEGLSLWKRQMIGRVRRAIIVRAMLALVLIGYSLPGWCPPPPGALRPDFQAYNFGDVALGDTARMSISLLVNPLISSTETFFISDRPPTFTSNQEDSFSVDAARTTCKPGVIVTTTSGCSVTVTFTPRTPGPKSAKWLSISLCRATFPCPTGNFPGSTLSFVGSTPVAAIPMVSGHGILLLGLLVLAIAARRFLHGAP